jgi:hypothetical protein
MTGHSITAGAMISGILIAQAAPMETVCVDGKRLENILSRTTNKIKISDK